MTFLGSGDPHRCLHLLEDFVYKAEPNRCHPKPCAIGPVYQPNIKAVKTFYAVSAFLYTLDILNILHTDSSFTPRDMKRAAKTFCAKVSHLFSVLSGVSHHRIAQNPYFLHFFVSDYLSPLMGGWVNRCVYVWPFSVQGRPSQPAPYFNMHSG